MSASSANVPLTAPEIQRAVGEIQWMHHFDLGGIQTPGRASKGHQDWLSTVLPSDLANQSVLDIGAWDGFFSFLAEERGARRVLAIDNFQNPDLHRAGTAGFDLVKKLRNSKVEYRVMDAMGIDSWTERFDCVFFLGVYYHLRDPFRALRAIRNILAPGGRLYLEGLVVPGARPLLRFFAPEEIEPTTFCGATLSGIETMLSATGFSQVRLLGMERGAGPISRWIWRNARRFQGDFRNVGIRRGIRALYPRAAFEASVG
jgi:tRNA (mo5U34)-methyltransferase